MPKNKIEIYTDGSCKGNPGPGGWAALILLGETAIKLSGREPDTTNNRMEMTAIIKALNWLHKKSDFSEKQLSSLEVVLHSDSNLIVRTMNENWKRKKNTDLWEKIDTFSEGLNLKWTWVKAHATNKYNNLVDEMAFKEASKA